MMIRVALSYDAKSLDSVSDKIEAFISNHRHILQWALPFPGCYLLKVDTDFSTMYASVKPFFAKNNFFMVEIVNVKSDGANGMLPKGVWGWLKDDQNLEVGGFIPTPKTA